MVFYWASYSRTPFEPAFPLWAEIVGWIIALLAIAVVPCVTVFGLARTNTHLPLTEVCLISLAVWPRAYSFHPATAGDVLAYRRLESSRRLELGLRLCWKSPSAKIRPNGTHDNFNYISNDWKDLCSVWPHANWTRWAYIRTELYEVFVKKTINDYGCSRFDAEQLEI